MYISGLLGLYYTVAPQNYKHCGTTKVTIIGRCPFYCDGNVMTSSSPKNILHEILINLLSIHVHTLYVCT